MLYPVCDPTKCTLINMYDGLKIMDKSAEDRINIALETLKNELVSSRL
jgi:hypothetical protein